jgi:hypothetical protein
LPELLHLDLETRSTVDLKVAGPWVYAQHPSTDLWCACWAIGDGPIQTWRPGDPPPSPLVEHVTAGHPLVAHNAMAFERVIWRHILAPRYGWPEPALEQWHCTAALAAAMALPRSLNEAARALGLPVQKDMGGHRLMLQMARPRLIEPDGRIIWWAIPDKVRRLIAYCRQDVEVERALHRRLRPLSDEERELFLLDARINERGVAVDLQLVGAAERLVAETQAELDAEMYGLTGGVVEAATQAGRLVTWLRTRGIEAESVDKPAVAELLDADLPDDVRRVLEVRAEAARSSTAKLQAFRARTCRDGRLRDNLLYHGAATGRWSGKGLQAQNLPRPSTVADVDAAIRDIRAGKATWWIDLFHGPPMGVVSDCLRGMLVAGPGMELIAADFAAIEARVLAWLAGQRDLVRLFATGGDVYRHMAAEIYGWPADSIAKGSLERQLGKQAVLGCFAAGTPVLTTRGWVPIEAVSTTDRLWDGIEWVGSDGVVERGLKHVINLAGVAVTPDHEILTEEGWRTASQVAHAGTRCLRSAIVLASSRLPASSMAPEAACGRSSANAAAEPKAGLTSTICGRGGLPDVIGAPGGRQRLRTAISKALACTWRTIASAVFGQTATLQCWPVAMIQRVAPTRATGAAGSALFQSGTTGGGSCATSSCSPAGTTPAWSSIASTTTAPTASAIVAWRHVLSRTATRGRRLRSSTVARGCARRTSTDSIALATGAHRPSAGSSAPARRLTRSSASKTAAAVPTYDIANAGPRHRFTILTEAGPLLVHNCGYGLGAAKFVTTCANAGIEIAQAMAERVVHTYRATNHRIVALWRELEDAAMRAVEQPGAIIPAAADRLRFRVKGGFLWLVLPSGRPLAYASPRIEDVETPWGELRPQVTHLGVTSIGRKWERQTTYGGRWSENATQAIARDLLAAAMLRLEAASYPVVLSVHDEIVAEVPAGFGSVEQFERIMCQLPDWAQGCPVAAEGWRGLRYRK